MADFEIINKASEITLSKEWVCLSEFSSLNRIVDEQGKKAGSNYAGRRYKIIQKWERDFTISERIGNGLLGIIATICTCFTGPFFSKSIRNLFTKRKVKRRFAIAISEPISQGKIKTKAGSNITVTIPPEVKKTLDKLFEDSPYAIDTLPIYPIILNKKCNRFIKKKKMTAPIMKGTTEEGHPFIAIKVDCDLRDEDIEKYSGMTKKFYKTHRQLKGNLWLSQYGSKGPLAWDQIGGDRLKNPSFFTWNFTYSEDGSGPTNSQKDNFKRVQTLLKTGQSEDTQGLIWRISTE